MKELGRGRGRCDSDKLQCLVRGAKLASDADTDNIVDLLEQVSHKSVPQGLVKGIDEYRRAAEMFDIVASAKEYVAATLRSASKTKALARKPKADKNLLTKASSLESPFRDRARRPSYRTPQQITSAACQGRASWRHRSLTSTPL